MRTLGGILTTGGTADVTRLGWPTLRAGFPLMTFLNTTREIRITLAKRPAVYTAWIGLTIIAAIMFVLLPKFASKELAPNEDQGVIFGIVSAWLFFRA